MVRRVLPVCALILSVLSGWQGVAQAQSRNAANIEKFDLGGAVTNPGSAFAIAKPEATVQVIAQLTDPPLAIAVGANAKRLGTKMTLAQRQSYMAALKSKQDSVAASIVALGGKELARVGKAYNGVVVAIDAAKLPSLSKITGIAAVRPITDFELALSTTAPYVGSTALQVQGVTGAGTRIAILDSGIDYTHRNLGGSGLTTDFVAAAGNPTVVPVGLFPTAKVVGGYDFVGETWPNGPLAGDPNPIDAGVGAGHGTHVADIAAGASRDGNHKGIAPGAQLYAVKVCSSVATSCSGVAMLQGLDWAMDPHGDLSFADAPDVVNMSLGASYGQRENPTTEAVSNLVRFGIVVAVAAGNAGDRPFIVSSPSNAAEAISVAQTAMPDSRAIPLVVDAPASIAGVYGNTATVDWAPIVAGFTGNLRVAGAPGTNAALACTAADTINFSGTVALINRGVCSVSVKVANAAAKGAIGVIIANNAAGDAPSFSYGGGTPLVQTLVVTQGVGAMLRAALAGGPVLVTVSQAAAIPLAGSMASTSARGPGYNFATIKPEIGAPGASISAEYGTGTGETVFGGTSGATPVIAGTAALLLQKFPNATPAEIKSRLMNTANNTVLTNPATLPGELAPISRVGAGEVRVDRAAAVQTGVWDATNPYNVGLSFGTLRLTGITTLQKKVAVKNYGNVAKTYTITPTFRYANDAAGGAVQLLAPTTLTVPAQGTSAFVFKLVIDANKLPAWNLDSGSNHGTGSLLQNVEFDGYVTVTGGGESVRVPWHVLPHRSANVTADSVVNLTNGQGMLTIGNPGSAELGVAEVFALTGTSPQQSATQPVYGSGYALVDLKAVGVRGFEDGGVAYLQFALATYEERAHPAYPAEFDVYVDTNNDGVADYAIFNSELGGFGVSGQTVVQVFNLNTGSAVARFYVDAELMSANMIFTVRAADLGLSGLDQPFTYSVDAVDNYFTGSVTDSIPGMTYTPALPKFSLGGDTLLVPSGLSGGLAVTMPAGGVTASPAQQGFLLMQRNGLSGREASIVMVNP